MDDNNHSLAQRPTKKVVVVIEKAMNNYSAYVPDLPGGVATAGTLAEVEAEISAAIRFHLDGMQEDGLPIPTPSCQVHYLEAAA
jgi:predicted RNase H-like HicB family nuclease